MTVAGLVLVLGPPVDAAENTSNHSSRHVNMNIQRYKRVSTKYKYSSYYLLLLLLLLLLGTTTTVEIVQL